MLPDTQYLFDEDSSDPAPLRQTFRFLTEEDRNIAFMIHLGDVTEHGSEHEIKLAGDAFKIIDGRLPYSVLAGNHDVNSSTVVARRRVPRHRQGPPRGSEDRRDDGLDQVRPRLGERAPQVGQQFLGGVRPGGGHAQAGGQRHEVDRRLGQVQLGLGARAG